MLAWRKGGEVGDTFDSLIGFVDGRRGSHVTDATHGGYYGLMPHSSNGALCLSLLFATTPHNRLSRSAGFTGWTKAGWSDVCKAKFSPPPTPSPPPLAPVVSGGNAVSSELTDGELGGIIAGVIGFVVIIAVACTNPK